MKKIIFGFVCMFCVLSVHAIDLTLVSYDDTFYAETDPTFAGEGELTGISDIYYYYKPFEHTLIIKQTEWLGDGNGGQYIAQCNIDGFYYSDITFENFDKEIGLENDEIVLQNIADLRNQFEIWIEDNISNRSLRQFLLSETSFYDLESKLYNHIINNIDLSMTSVSRNIVKQHNIDIYNSVFGNTGFNDDKFSVWGTTLLNSMNKSSKYDYSTNGLGVVLGADLQLSDSILIGLGYSYSNIDVDINPSNILFDTSSVFLYSKWKPSKFYVNGIVGYNFADYEYIDSELNDGDVSGLFASVMAGYKTEYGISPEIGVRYTNIELNQNSEYLKKSKSDFYSVVAGANYENMLGDFVLGGRALVEFNIAKPDNKRDLDVLGYKYVFEIKDAERPLGAEFSVWAEYNINGINLRLNYDLRLHTDMVNRTGGLSLRYCF